ncbi:MAG: hypothetical protein AAF985_08650 [Bacteroidota bacterium]
MRELKKIIETKKLKNLKTLKVQDMKKLKGGSIIMSDYEEM